MPMPTSADAPREILIESLGSLSEEEADRLRGPGGAGYAERKLEALRENRKWVWALVGVMVLAAIVVPTAAFYNVYKATDSFSLLTFFGTVTGLCAFAGGQTGWAVYLYMDWRHRLRCYRSLRALGRRSASEEAAR